MLRSILVAVAAAALLATGALTAAAGSSHGKNQPQAKGQRNGDAMSTPARAMDEVMTQAQTGTKPQTQTQTQTESQAQTQAQAEAKDEDEDEDDADEDEAGEQTAPTAAQVTVQAPAEKGAQAGETGEADD